MLLQPTQVEIEHLKARDKILGAAIERIGPIRREGRSDLFSAVIHAIVGQQISAAAQETVWRRLKAALGEITPHIVVSQPVEILQACGMSHRKADYIYTFAHTVADGALDLTALEPQSDEEVIAALSAQKGIGVWTAEMLMLFSMRRPNILSYGDFAIRKGMRMLYRHPALPRPLFEEYRKRYDPYGSAASLYLWSIAGGAIPDLTDPQQPKIKIAKEK